jgi:prepilin-type N-terminal cleavage/methylation domain-containing protein
MFDRLPTSRSLACGHIRRAGGFGLIELMIAVMIIAIIGAIAIPRLSRGSASPADRLLVQSLSVLRNALDRYQLENDGVYPTAANLSAALLQYNDGAGPGVTYSATRDAAHPYGPYLSAVPPLPVGTRRGGIGIATLDAVGVGWIYTEGSGTITPNTTTEADARGVLYNTY